MRTKIMVAVIVAGLVGYVVGRGTTPRFVAQSNVPAVLRGHFDDFSLVQRAFAQSGKAEAMPFGYDDPRDPKLAPDAPPPTYWNIDDVRKAHTELAERAAKKATEAGTGSSQSFSGGPVHLQTRTFSMFMLYRVHRDKPVLSLTKVNSLWDDAEQHAGAYDFYVFTGGTGEMIVGGKIANRQNLHDKDGIIPGEYRGQPIIGGQTFKVKAGDWLVIPPNAPHQPKPDEGGFSYMIMKLNTGLYPWALVR